MLVNRDFSEAWLCLSRCCNRNYILVKMVNHDAEFYISASESLKERKGHQFIFCSGETNYCFTLCMKILGLV